MTYAIKTADGWHELLPNEQVMLADELVASYDTVLSWSPQQRTAWDIKAIVDDGVPEGKVAVGYLLEDRGGKPFKVHALQDAPPPPPPAPVVVYPADLWRRATDAEAEAIDAAMKAAPLRQRKLFEAASTYNSGDPLWPTLMGTATQLFGKTRAEQLLAPSN